MNGDPSYHEIVKRQYERQQRLQQALRDNRLNAGLANTNTVWQEYAPWVLLGVLFGTLVLLGWAGWL